MKTSFNLPLRYHSIQTGYWIMDIVHHKIVRSDIQNHRQSNYNSGINNNNLLNTQNTNS